MAVALCDRLTKELKDSVRAQLPVDTASELMDSDHVGMPLGDDQMLGNMNQQLQMALQVYHIHHGLYCVGDVVIVILLITTLTSSYYFCIPPAGECP